MTAKAELIEAKSLSRRYELFFAGDKLRPVSQIAAMLALDVRSLASANSSIRSPLDFFFGNDGTEPRAAPICGRTRQSPHLGTPQRAAREPRGHRTSCLRVLDAPTVSQGRTLRASMKGAFGSMGHCSDYVCPKRNADRKSPFVTIPFESPQQ
jgi:hypothetical protein